LNHITEAGFNFDDPSRGQGNYGHRARDVRLDRAGHIQRRYYLALQGLRQGKKFWMVHLEVVGIELSFNDCLGRRLCGRIDFGLIAANQVKA
jgi:hypothetical protein